MRYHLVSTGVLGDVFIRRENSQTACDSLAYQHPVEGIFVQRGQLRQMEGVVFPEPQASSAVRRAVRGNVLLRT
jgi:hypothetical protein